jgi:cupin superfamily acireductone dioxygenase involved in methionine salvage
MFKKKFDHEDLYNYLPDNYTIGTYQFYKLKFQDKLDDHRCRYLEAISRKEFDEVDLLEILEDYEKQQNAIISEYNLRHHHSEPDAHYKMLREIKSKVKLYE